MSCWLFVIVNFQVYYDNKHACTITVLLVIVRRPVSETKFCLRLLAPDT
jgi:hypothetical protein